MRLDSQQQHQKLCICYDKHISHQAELLKINFYTKGQDKWSEAFSHVLKYKIKIAQDLSSTSVPYQFTDMAQTDLEYSQYKRYKIPERQ